MIKKFLAAMEVLGGSHTGQKHMHVISFMQTIVFYVRLEVFTAVKMIMTIIFFRILVPCRLVGRCRPYINPSTSRIGTSTLKMQIVCFSETLESTYECTRRKNPEQQQSHQFFDDQHTEETIFVQSPSRQKRITFCSSADARVNEKGEDGIGHLTPTLTLPRNTRTLLKN
jgi:hypothetical protein